MLLPALLSEDERRTMVAEIDRSHHDTQIERGAEEQGQVKCSNGKFIVQNQSVQMQACVETMLRHRVRAYASSYMFNLYLCVHAWPTQLLPFISTMPAVERWVRAESERLGAESMRENQEGTVKRISVLPSSPCGESSAAASIRGLNKVLTAHLREVLHPADMAELKVLGSSFQKGGVAANEFYHALGKIIQDRGLVSLMIDAMPMPAATRDELRDVHGPADKEAGDALLRRLGFNLPITVHAAAKAEPGAPSKTSTASKPHEAQPSDLLCSLPLKFAANEPAVNRYTEGGFFAPHSDNEALTVNVLLVDQAEAFSGGGTCNQRCDVAAGCPPHASSFFSSSFVCVCVCVCVCVFFFFGGGGGGGGGGRYV